MNEAMECMIRAIADSQRALDANDIPAAILHLEEGTKAVESCMLFFQNWLNDARKNLSLLKKAASQSNALEV